MRAPTALSVFPAADGALNFARDDALLARARATGEELIRVYSWNAPVVSFGRNERVAGRFSPERLRAAHLTAVRRPTGGRALLHHRELTYAVAGPAAAGDTLASTYRRLNELLAEALARMGVKVEITAAGGAGPADGAPCFAAPSAGELVADGRKLVASSQWRGAGAFVQHGSILVDDDQGLLEAGVTEGHQLPPVPRPATLRALLGRAPAPADLAAALSAVIADRTGRAPLRIAPELLLPEAEVRARAAHYEDPAWTWRR